MFVAYYKENASIFLWIPIFTRPVVRIQPTTFSCPTGVLPSWELMPSRLFRTTLHATYMVQDDIPQAVLCNDQAFAIIVVMMISGSDIT